MRTLTPEEARTFYDRFGRKQDSQTFYEAPALDALVTNAALADAGRIFEFGCGTGRFALELLRRRLPRTALYCGVDLSTTMVRLASKRLAPFGPRAFVALASGEPMLPRRDASVDRFISTYVLDLLPDSSVRHVLVEARRVLRPGGLICLAGASHGTTAVSRLVMRSWQWLFARRPMWVGGCRPIELADFLPSSAWDVRFHTVVIAWGVASEVLIASPLGPAGASVHAA